jgi:hypothetical protein
VRRAGGGVSAQGRRQHRCAGRWSAGGVGAQGEAASVRREAASVHREVVVGVGGMQRQRRRRRRDSCNASLPPKLCLYAALHLRLDRRWRGRAARALYMRGPLVPVGITNHD